MRYFTAALLAGAFCSLIACLSNGCGSKRVTLSVIGDPFTNKPYILTLVDPIDPPSGIRKLIGANLASDSFKNIKFSPGNLYIAMKDFGKTPRVVIGQPFVVIGLDFGNSPHVNVRGRRCLELFRVKQGRFTAMLLQVPSDSPNGMQPVRAHRKNGKGTIMMPMNVYRLGVVVNTTNSSMTRFEIRKAKKYKEDIPVPAPYNVSEIAFSKDGLLIIAGDMDEDALLIWPIDDLPIDLMETSNSSFVSFPIVLDLDNIPGAETLPIPLEPRGFAISEDGDTLAVSLAAISTVGIIDISYANDLQSLMGANDLECSSNYSLASVALMPTDVPEEIEFSPNGDYLLTLNRTSHTVSVIDANNASLVGTIDFQNTAGTFPTAVAFSKSKTTGKEYAHIVFELGLGGVLGSMASLDLTEYTENGTVNIIVHDVGLSPRGIAAEVGGHFAVISNYGDHDLTIIDLELGEVLPDRIACPTDAGPAFVTRYNKYDSFFISCEQDNSVMILKLTRKGTVRYQKFVTDLATPGRIAIQQNPVE